MNRLLTIAALMMLAGLAHAGGDDDHGCRGNCERDDDGGSPIDIDIDIGGGEGGDGYGGEGGEGGQGGEGGDANAEGGSAEASADGTQTVIFEGTQSPGRGYVGGGSSSADHQKVRAISGGWLTGMAAIRWDATDKELRSLHRADNLRARGLIEAADLLECSTKVIYKAVGGNREECVRLITQERAESSMTTSRDREQDQLILALQMQLVDLQEREVPELEEAHTGVRIEMAQVSADLEEGQKARAQLEALAAQYRRDRAAEEDRLDRKRGLAQGSLNTLAQKGYTHDNLEQSEEPPDE